MPPSRSFATPARPATHGSNDADRSDTRRRPSSDPTPVDEAVARCEELAAAAAGDRRTEALVRNSLAQLYSMQGKFDLARSTWATADAMLKDLEMALFSAALSITRGQIELLAGDLGTAEAVLERGYAALESMGGAFLLTGVAGVLGRVSYAQQRLDKVDRLSTTIEGMADADDLDAQTDWRLLRALARAKTAGPMRPCSWRRRPSRWRLPVMRPCSRAGR